MLITIVVSDGMMEVVEGKANKARLVWSAAGLAVFVCGSLAGAAFNQAGNLAMHACEERHIPVSSLRRVG